MSQPEPIRNLVLSPFLSDVDVSLSQERDDDDAADFIELLATRRIVLVKDVLRETTFALSAGEYDGLRKLAALGRAMTAGELADVEGAEFLQREQLILEAEAARAQHDYHSIEIEINRHCNYRCEFCPVSLRPKPRHNMPSDLFAYCLDEVVDCGASAVSLNHYSEPTLHPQLIEYIRSAVTKGLRVRLHTNASLLDDDKLAALAELRDSVYIVVNLPTIVEQEFERVVGAKLYKRVLRNIRALADAGVPLSLSINAPFAARAATVAKINAALGEHLGEQVSWPTDDRTGLIQLGTYAEPVTHRGPLAGCLYALRTVNIAFDGSVFLCCQDFDQQYVAGNIRDEPLRAILAGERMAELRSHVFGITDAPDDFICRRCSWTTSRHPSSDLRVGAGRRRARALLTEEITLSDKTAALLESAR